MTQGVSSLALPAARPRTWTLALVGALAGLALGAWLLTAGRMDGMDTAPGADPGALGFYVITWMVMMAAMMLPAVVPMVLAHSAHPREHTAAPALIRAGAIVAFIAGYLACWTVFGLCAYALDALVRGLHVGLLRWEEGGRYLAGSAIVAAAVYQLSPGKQACLSRCRAARAFVDARWREGAAGSLLMGVEHGAWCIGCCWALIAALFALGVMSLAWMALVAALIALERLAPWRRPASATAALVLVALGLAVALVPGSVPLLTQPGAGAMTMGR